VQAVQDERRVVVIGSGPTGAMAASVLVQRGIPVTLLESGVRPPEGVLVRALGRNLWRRVPPLGQGPFDSPSDPRPEWHVHLGPGGLSCQWTGAVPRFAPDDFTEGERLHERYRWPVTYEELVPWYEAAERVMSVTGPPRDVPGLPAGRFAWTHALPGDWQPLVRTAEARGQGFAALPLADGPPWLLARRGTAFNSFTGLVRPLLRSPLFRLLTGAHALRLEWDGAVRQAAAVVYQSRLDGSQHRLEAAAFVVAAGPLWSTKLLFDSACPDFPRGLGDSRGLLGTHLHDHPKEWWGLDLDRPLSLLAPAAYLTRIPCGESAPLLSTSWTLGVTNVRDRVRSRFGLKGTAVGVQVFGTMIPSDAHFVRPSSTVKDEFGLPGLEICIRFDEAVLSNVVRARGHLMCLLEEAGIRCRLRPVEPQLRPGNAVHYGGTVRMHADPRYGLLNAWNRMHEVPNVAVCDASSFTTGCEKNPTLTAMALAARAADRLAADLKAV